VTALTPRGDPAKWTVTNPEEKEALEEAVYALRAFRTAWEHAEAA
jgi:hypothetical protein